jgi:hypothetical protein
MQVLVPNFYISHVYTFNDKQNYLSQKTLQLGLGITVREGGGGVYLLWPEIALDLV